MREELKNLSPLYDETGGIELAEKITGLAQKSIYEKAFRREIPFYQEVKGGKITFSRKDLENWHAERRRKTRNELRKELD